MVTPSQRTWGKDSCNGQTGSTAFARLCSPWQTTIDNCPAHTSADVCSPTPVGNASMAEGTNCAALDESQRPPLESGIETASPDDEDDGLPSVELTVSLFCGERGGSGRKKRNPRHRTAGCCTPRSFTQPIPAHVSNSSGASPDFEADMNRTANLLAVLSVLHPILDGNLAVSPA